MGISMKVTVTVTISQSNKSLDIRVEQEQKIEDTFQVIQDNLQIFPMDIKQIKSIRLYPYQRRIPTNMSFMEAGIYTGAHLLV